MPTYLILANGFANAERTIEGIDEGEEEATTPEKYRRLVSVIGGELLDMYYTAGEYDVAAIVEFADQESLVRAQKKALDLGVEDLTVLDAVHYEKAGELTRD